MNRQDTFGRADSASSLGTPSDGGAGYTLSTGSTWGISSNTAYRVSGTSNDQAVLEASASDVEVTVTGSILTDLSGCVARWADENNFLLLYFANAGVNSSTIYLYKKVSGSFTAVATKVNTTVGNTDVMKISCSGSTIQCYQNGSLITFDDTLSSHTITDGQTNTKHGLLANGSSSRFDQLDITDLGGGGGTLTAGTISVTGHTSSTVDLSLATDSGGTSPYSNQLQQAPDVAGSPGTWANVGTPETGATATFTASGLTASTTYWFRVVVTDSAGSPATENSNEVSQATDAPSGLAAGTASFVDATDTQANLTCTAVSGGTAPYTYSWERATSATGSFSATGLTTLTAADTGLSVGQHYWWRLAVTDDASQTAYSNLVYGNLWQAPLVFGAIGDSILAGYLVTAGQEPPTLLVDRLAKLTKQRKVSLGSNSASAGSTTANWLIGSGSNLLAPAEAAFSSASVTDIVLMLGTNDARSSVSAATYGSNLSAICTHLLANVGTLARVWLCYPPWSTDTGTLTAARYQLLTDYQSQIDSLVNGTTIRQGDRLAMDYFAAHTSELSDGIHPSDTGAASLALLQANAIDNSLNLGGATPGEIDDVTAQEVIDAVLAGITSDHGSGSYARNTEPDNTSIAAILEDTGTTLPATLGTIAGYLDTEITAIKAKTDNLPADPAGLSALATAHGAGSWATATGFSTLDAAGVRGAVGLASANLDTQLAAIAGYIDTEVASTLAAVDTEVSAIKAKTDQLTFTTANRVDASAGNVTLADGAITDAKFTMPAEAAGQPSGALATIRRIGERLGNKVVRDRDDGTVLLRNAADSGNLETRTQSTDGTVDTQTKAV